MNVEILMNQNQKVSGHCGALQDANIREHMEVITSCGCHVGQVDRVEGDKIKLTKSDSPSGGQHHYIPTSWVALVDDRVHLNKDVEETKQLWQKEARASM
jgi:hypothetical protein